MSYTLELEIPETVAAKLRESHPEGIEGATMQALKTWMSLGHFYRTRLTEIADEEQLSFNGAIKRAIDFYGNDKASKRRQMAVTREGRAARDAKIVELAKSGIARAAIGKQVGLSTIRVNQIVADARAKENAEIA